LPEQVSAWQFVLSTINSPTINYLEPVSFSAFQLLPGRLSAFGLVISAFYFLLS
jgi:hypothetical protein